MSWNSRKRQMQILKGSWAAEDVIFGDREGEKDALKNTSSSQKWVVAASTREELLSNARVVSDEMTRATAKFREVRDKISTPSKELAEVAQLNSSMKSLGDHVAFH